MQATSLIKVTASSAAEICARVDLDDQSRALLADGMTPEAFLDALIERSRHIDAVAVLAHALPKREATWWACLGAREALDPDHPGEQAALEAAEAWVLKPSDKRGRTAMEQAESAGTDTPAGLAALAAFFAGASISPPGYDPVPPGETVTARTVFGAILVAAYRDRANPDERFKRLLRQGIDIAKGGSGRIDRGPTADSPRLRSRMP